MATNEMLMTMLSEFIDTSLFHVVDEDEASIRLRIVPQVFMQNIAPFMREQYSLYEKRYHCERADIMQQRIDEFGDYNKLMESLEDEGVLKSRSHSYFETTYFSDGYKVLSTGLILPFYAGKAYIEGYYGLFAYMTKLIHMSSSNPLKGAVAVDLYG